MQCPSCHQEVDVHDNQIGALYTCPKCSSVYFINFDGIPEYGEQSVELAGDFIQAVENSEGQQSEIESVEDRPISDFISLESIEPAVTPNEPIEAGLTTMFGQQIQSSVDSPIASLVPIMQSALDDIQSFANQDHEVSALSYHLKIMGLDTKEILAQFQEAIEDSKLGWVATDILSSIKNGDVEIKDLTAVQAFILARRLQTLDVQKEWKQNVLV